MCKLYEIAFLKRKILVLDYIKPKAVSVSGSDDRLVEMCRIRQTADKDLCSTALLVLTSYDNSAEKSKWFCSKWLPLKPQLQLCAT